MTHRVSRGTSESCCPALVACDPTIDSPRIYQRRRLIWSLSSRSSDGFSDEIEVAPRAQLGTNGWARARRHPGAIMRIPISSKKDKRDRIQRLDVAGPHTRQSTTTGTDNGFSAGGGGGGGGPTCQAKASAICLRSRTRSSRYTVTRDLLVTRGNRRLELCCAVLGNMCVSSAGFGFPGTLDPVAAMVIFHSRRGHIRSSVRTSQEALFSN